MLNEVDDVGGLELRSSDEVVVRSTKVDGANAAQRLVVINNEVSNGERHETMVDVGCFLLFQTSLTALKSGLSRETIDVEAPLTGVMLNFVLHTWR